MRSSGRRSRRASSVPTSSCRRSRRLEEAELLHRVGGDRAPRAGAAERAGVRADVPSSAEDAAYWSWVSGLATARHNWSSSAGTITDLRNGLNAFFNAHATPTQLRGVLK